MKTAVPPALSFLGGVGTLRASVLLESYALLGSGLVLSMLGVLWLAGSFTPKDRRPKAGPSST